MKGEYWNEFTAYAAATLRRPSKDAVKVDFVSFEGDMSFHPWVGELALGDEVEDENAEWRTYYRVSRIAFDEEAQGYVAQCAYSHEDGGDMGDGHTIEDDYTFGEEGA